MPSEMPSETTTPSLAHRARTNIQWFTNKHMRQVSRLNAKQHRVNMMTAENWSIRDELVDQYKALFGQHLSPRHLSYADGMGGDAELLQAASDFFNRVFAAHSRVQPAHLVVGAGCSSLLENLLYDICEPGEGVLIETPFWGGFETSFVLRSSVTAVHVTPPSDGIESGDLDHLVSVYIDAYERALRHAPCRIKAILVCNPHNPCGHIYPPTVIQALLQFAQRHNLFYISDEIYALSTLDERTPFTSVLSIDVSALGVDLARVFTLYSISKDLGSSGLRLGFGITQAHPDLRLSLAISNHSRVSTFTSLVITALLRDTETVDTILHQNRAALQRSAKLISDFLAFHQIPFVPPAAGVYLWARLGCRSSSRPGDEPSWDDEARVNDRFEAAGMSVGAGQGYCASEPGWFRITFAIPREELVEGLRRIEQVVGMEGKKWTA
ncbi:aminotransferase gliI [Aspergillus fischeri NRRL 181]|uniref:Aminotransferase, putative n=1 Tax=Neosartorya fischeri (strain ATCC 1020 / DSM 3700 / CBS 544.65 / FGSC A1164 / JCM 1740 / NRRL 181 / WB 181) TaxID=331117 RepID=A1DN13_NEOFI|nr:aminotransferase, putative [Aspergillus fischeri NRRL 181]EAW16184.1 aminotransferase, putative [Aspergillus fischeri NRRL 181]